MAIASIEALYEAVCELEGPAPQALRRAPSGNSSFSLRVMDVPMSVVQYSARPSDVYLIVTMGQLPDHLLLEGARLLLAGNLLTQGFGTQVFGRDAESGDCMLYCAFPLQEATPAYIYQRMVALARLTDRWRDGFFINGAPVQADEATALHDLDLRANETADASGRKFMGLCGEAGRLLGNPEAGAQQSGDALAMTFRAGEHAVIAMHYPLRDPRSVHLLVPMGRPEGELELPVLLAAMATNLSLIASPKDVAYSRDALTGQIVFQSRQALDEFSAEQLLAQVHSAADQMAGVVQPVAPAAT